MQTQDIARLDARIDALTDEVRTGFARAFTTTQGGFDEFRAYSEFLVDGLRRETQEGFARLRGEMHDRFAKVDVRVDRLEGRMDRLEARMERLEERMDQLEKRMDRMEACMERMETQLGRLGDQLALVVRLVSDRRSIN